MSITELSINRPILIIVFFIVVSLLGMFAVTQLKYELLPKINTPFVSIVAVYPGASPQEIENVITKKMEDAVATVSKIKRITSRSNEGYAIIGIEFIQDADLDQALQDVQRAVNQVMPEMPSAVKNPSIDKFSLSDLPVLRLSVTSDLPEADLYQLIKDQVKPRISQLKGVGRTQLLGGREKEVKVLLDEEKLKFHRLPLLSIVQAIGKANMEIPIGSIKDKEAQFGLKMSNKIKELQTLRNLEIAQFPDGSKITLGQIASIEEGFKEERTLSRLNGKASIAFSIQKQSNANAVEVAESLKEELENIERDFSAQGLHFEVALDSSEFTLKAAETVFEDLLIAIALVAIVMLVFLHSIRNALIVMLAIPTSLVFAFLGMWAMDFSLNLMTLLAMSLVIGVLVDDSIVVLENIYRHLEMGKDSRKAALEGRNEISYSAISITLVDVVVFLPLAFVPGVTGGLVKEFALVIVISTLASLLVCFTLTPMMASRFARLEHLSNKNLLGMIILFIDRRINQLILLYGGILKASLRRRWLVYGLILAMMVASFSLLTEGFIGGEFIPSTDKGEITLTVELPSGTKFEESEQTATQIENMLSEMKEVKRVLTTVGLSTDAFFGEVTGDNQMEFSIALLDKKERKETVQQISNKIKNKVSSIPGTRVKVAPVGLIGTEASPIQILISGADRDSVLKGAQKVFEWVEQIEGTNDVRLSIQKAKPELEILYDRERIHALGLNNQDVATALRIAYTGYDELKYRKGNTEYPIRIQLEKKDRNRTDQLGDIGLINEKGDLIYLKQFAQIRRINSAGALERRNKNASVILFSKAIGKSVNEIGEEIKKILSENPLPSGVNISYEGDLELADNSFLYLGLALMAGITLVYLIMVALYNSFVYPFVVLFSIPVALIGAFLALALTMKTLNVFSIFGLIMMLGLVAKNAILIVDRANELLKNDYGVLYALMDAGKTRLRPILMTTLAMVIGMLPLAFQQGAGAESNSSLAWVLIGGLSSSMFLTLVLVPSVYLDVYRVLNYFSTKKKVVKVEKAIMACLVLGMILYAGGSSAQSKLSLLDAENKLESDNPELQIARLRMQEAGYGIKEAKGLYLPTVNFSGNYIYNIKPQVFFLPATFFDPSADPNAFESVRASAKNAYQANLNLSMPLLQFSNRYQVENAMLNQQDQGLNLEVIKTGLMADLRKLYYASLFAMAQKQFLLENQKRQEAILEEAKNRWKQGFLIEADTLNPYIQLENIGPQLLKTENALLINLNQIRLLLNLPEEESIVLTDSLQLPIAFEKMLDFDPTNRADIRRLELQRKMVFNNQKMAQSRLMPELQFIGQYSWLTQDEKFDFGKYRWVNATYIGLQLNIPIFNGFQVKNKIQQFRLQEKQIQIQQNYVRQQANTETKVYTYAMLEIQKQLQVQQQVIKAAERSYSLVYDRWEKGLSKYTELNEAMMNLLQSKNNQMELVYHYLVNRVEWMRCRGE